jgi:hypothetical protein
LIIKKTTASPENREKNTPQLWQAQLRSGGSFSLAARFANLSPAQIEGGSESS